MVGVSEQSTPRIGGRKSVTVRWPSPDARVAHARGAILKLRHAPRGERDASRVGSPARCQASRRGPEVASAPAQRNLVLQEPHALGARAA